MDQLVQMPLIRSNDIHASEKFTDLVFKSYRQKKKAES